LLPPDKSSELPFFDANGDGWLSPVDALLPINELNIQRDYAAGRVQNTVGETEHRVFRDGFHFASVLRNDTTGILAIRLHPDQNDANGWGSTLYIGPFIGGADAGSGQLRAMQLLDDGVRIAATGTVTSPGNTTFGTWQWEVVLGYDGTSQLASTTTGSLSISIPDVLAAATGDLNIYRIHSNLLQNVPRRFNPDGDTGDMNRVEVAYAPTPDPRNFTWSPQLIPAHFPSEASNYLGVTVVGELNDVDSQKLGLPGTILPAFKPTLSVVLSSALPIPITFGGAWITAEAQNPFADNVSVDPLVRRGDTDLVNFSFDVGIQASPIPR